MTILAGQKHRFVWSLSASKQCHSNASPASTANLLQFLSTKNGRKSLPAVGIEPTRGLPPGGFYVLCICRIRGIELTLEWDLTVVRHEDLRLAVCLSLLEPHWTDIASVVTKSLPHPADGMRIEPARSTRLFVSWRSGGAREPAVDSR